MTGQSCQAGGIAPGQSGRPGQPRRERPAARRVRWLRGVTIATAAIILASCRSLTAPVLVPMAAQLGVSRHACDVSAEADSAAVPSTIVPPGVVVDTDAASRPVSRSGSDLWPAALGLAGRGRKREPAQPEMLSPEAVQPESIQPESVQAEADTGRPQRAAVALPIDGPTFLLQAGIDVPLDGPPPAADELAGGSATPAVCQTEADCPAGTVCEASCPPVPRSGRRHCRPTAPCRACGECSDGGCAPEVCIPRDRAVPAVGPYLVCDGGDCLAPARPSGRSGILNLTAGDTVARYRADDTPPRRFVPPAEATRRDESGAADSAVEERGEEEAAEACLAVSNCACVYSPRFSSVREIIRPLEEAAPVGPSGLALDTVAEADVGRQPVWGSTQRVALEAARKALPGVAIEERIPALAVDQNEIPRAADNAELPAERVSDEQPLLTLRTQRPLLKVGFDVPLAWTCVKGANVLLNEQTADVIAADRGTATLRFEEPGRCELTLCKRAGSDTARIGEELDFTIYLLNSGDRALTDIVLVDALPRRLELIPDSAGSSLPADFSTETGDDGSVVLKWRFTGTLRPNEAGFVRFRTIVR
jgi:uncharacterized repeat protein (TIGR01451 family)